MACKECGHENNPEARFCGACGALLEASRDEHRLVLCTNCHSKNMPGSKYCAGCGVALGHRVDDRRHKHGHRQDQPKKKLRPHEGKGWTHPYALTFLILSGLSLVFYVVAINTIVKRQERPARIIEAKTKDLVLEAKVLEVASEFICSCGTCGEKPLDICRCDTAIEERQFIRTALQAGQSRNDVTLGVQTTFGWVKPQFSAKIDSLSRISGRKVNSASRPGLPASVELKVPDRPAMKLQGTRLSPMGAPVIATLADRDWIFSQFKCPCGQCGIDELKDCTCRHPRGATEVKSFVDEKIREQRFTVAQIVDEVEGTYGSRKD